MPVRKKLKKPSIRVVALCALAVLTLTVLSFANEGEYRNLFVFGALSLVLLACFVSCYRQRERVRSCTIYNRATVARVNTTEGKTFLTLQHSVYGQTVESTVQYFEKPVLYPGQVVGILYNENNPKLSVLRIYKQNSPGYTRRTFKDYKNGIVALFIFGAFLASLGLALFCVVNVKSGEYCEEAWGTVVSYEVQYDFHTADTPGTYDYTPVVEYAVDGQTCIAKSIQSQLVKTYDIGQEVLVHYSEENPNAVLIDGDDTTVRGATLLIALGCLFLLVGVINIIRAPKVWKSYEDLEKGIDFL